jgi:hypothetical protein
MANSEATKNAFSSKKNVIPAKYSKDFPSVGNSEGGVGEAVASRSRPNKNVVISRLIRVFHKHLGHDVEEP